MKLYSQIALGVASIVVAAACNKASFEGTHKNTVPPPPPVPQNYTVKIDGIENADAGSKTVQTIDTFDFVIQAAGPKVHHDTDDTSAPVDLYFVVDTTNSMTSVVSQIRSGMKGLVAGLKDRKTDLWVGIIGFVDDQTAIDERTFKLSGDINLVQSFLDTSFKAGNARSNGTSFDNVDYPESSLLGMQNAIQHFSAGEGRKNALKVVVMISDVVGHNGTGGYGQGVVRDCKVAPLVSSINAFAANAANVTSPDRFKLYYLVPDLATSTLTQAEITNDSATCEVAPGQTVVAKTQMELIMSQINPTIPAANRGGPILDSKNNLAWPMRDNNLVNTLIPLLEQHKQVDHNLSCLARSAQLFDAGKAVYSWTAEDLAKIGASQNNEILLSKAIKDARPKGSNDLELRIDRCCVEGSNLSCVDQYTQVVKYKVVNN